MRCMRLARTQKGVTDAAGGTHTRPHDSPGGRGKGRTGGVGGQGCQDALEEHEAAHWWACWHPCQAEPGGQMEAVAR